MSNIYHREPPTFGKVLLHTTYGDIDVELWSKECPKACRNFVQLALDGYYDDTIFHRIVTKFMVQGGDPTGTGKGGQSIYGKPFKDEIHSRIQFNHRGQVAMANDNEPNTNRSQFFITLDNCPWLAKKHTIFGKVTGNTVFNVLRMGDLETGADDRPKDPPKLTSVEVLLNPFDDVCPRHIKTVAQESKEEQRKQEEAKKRKRKKAQSKKDFKVLSFGDEAEEEEMALTNGGTEGEGGGQNGGGQGKAVKKKKKMVSAHDVLNDERLSKEKAYEGEELGKQSEQANGRGGDEEEEEEGEGGEEGRQGGGGEDRGGGGKRKKRDRESGDEEKEEKGDEGDFAAKMRRKMLETRRRLDGADGGEGREDEAGGRERKREEKERRAKEEEKAQRKELKKRARSQAEEHEERRDELKIHNRAAKVMTGQERAKYDAEQASVGMMSVVEQRRAKYKQRKAAHGNREEETLAKLAAFSKGMRESKKKLRQKEQQTGEGGDSEAYNGQVLEGKLYEGEEDETGWMHGKLKFKRHIDDDARAGRGSDGRSASEYVTLDDRKAPPGGRGGGGGGGGMGRGMENERRAKGKGREQQGDGGRW